MVVATSGEALCCETWTWLGGGSRTDRICFEGCTFFKETPSLCPGEIEQKKENNETIETVKTYQSKSFSLSQKPSYSVITAQTRTRADSAYFKVYAVYGNHNSRSVNDLWVGAGYWMDFFECKYHVIPGFGFTTHKHYAMQVDSAWVGIDIAYDVTAKWTMYGEFSYHFARFRKKKRSDFKFARKKGHAVTMRLVTDFYLYEGWHIGFAVDTGDWQSSDSKSLQWKTRAGETYVGYYF